MTYHECPKYFMQVHHILDSKLYNIQKLGVPYFYRYAVVQGDHSLERLADTLTNNPSHIRSLFTHVSSTSSSQLLSHIPHLTRLCSLQSVTPGGEIYAQDPALTFQGLSTLAGTAGTTLIDLTGQPIVRSSVLQHPLLSMVSWPPARWIGDLLQSSHSHLQLCLLTLLQIWRDSFASLCDSFLRLLGCMVYVLLVSYYASPSLANQSL